MTSKQSYIFGSFIFTLPDKEQDIIKSEIINSLRNIQEMNVLEINKVLDSAMNGRVKDLEFLVDLNLLLKRF